ncbi:hypothetical protein [Constantimarinum furrinae]|uniref:Lipoprotein n=1 Tax=Constantimarinum furrinae TaxID=2562285 RepID=A0A7G8PXY5_9FLAO|nr:hypothetical protein [Constantimarinum furrinae]QNJ99201.1 hypothetical protein ALE3EI_2674 [Constantimarinum furrinae]
MRQTITLLTMVLLLLSCNSVKRNQKFLARGDYDQAIELAVKKLQKDKTSAKSDEHIVLLEEAYKKVVEDDIRRIAFLKKENRAGSTREIYYTYRGLEYRQQLLRPLLPLYSETLGRNARLKIVDYSNEMIAAQNAYANYLYAEGEQLLNRNTTDAARQAYDMFLELSEIKPGYRNVAALIDEARFRGTHFVYVTLNNRSGQIIPIRLERELLDFNTYGLDDFWTEYHSQRENGINYKYGISLNFRDINISPERISEREVRRTQRIKDGWEYKKDRNGNIVKDENGKPIKVDIYKTVSAVLLITEQSKSAFVGGTVIYRDLERNRDLNKHPISTEFIFENVFATFRGDERALSDDDTLLLDNRFIPFPANSQMVYDAGEEIKIRFKEILKDNSF